MSGVSADDGLFSTRSLVRFMIVLQLATLFFLATTYGSGPAAGLGAGKGALQLPIWAPAVVSNSGSSASSSCVAVEAERAELREQLQQCSERKTYYRKEWGACTCKFTHTGPRGGYCVHKNLTTDNEIISEGLANQLIQLFFKTATVPGHPTVWDFGAGVGQYGLWFQAHAPNITWQGWDGAEGIEARTDGRVKFLDLTEPAFFSPRDWSMSLEVGEHIPVEYEQIFMDNLHRHNKVGIALSWAVPGQGGTNHINLRPNEYIIEQITKRGYRYDTETTNHIRQYVMPQFWFKNTFMVFRRL